MMDRCRDCDMNISGTCPVHPGDRLVDFDVGAFFAANKDAKGPGTWSNTAGSVLTPESFAEGIRRMEEQANDPERMKPRSVLVSPRGYQQAQTWRADPRYAEYDDATLGLSASHGLDPLTMTPEDFLWVWHNAHYI